MKEFKGTLGPWQALPEEVDKPYIRIRGTRIGGRFKIANILTPVYENVHEREADETRCNAQLIAASPDLLAALQQLVEIYDCTDGRAWTTSSKRRALDAAHAAIKKALGE
ncbi:hypothetical protein [Citrobacter phage vB_CfrS_K1M]